MRPLVAVHGGAGHHKFSAEEICLQAIKQKRHNLIDIIKYLEDDPVTNCGTGSNLTSDGEVECEAGICSSKDNVFGAIGCVKRIRNPIEVAALLAADAIQYSSTGLVKPSVLVADGAEKYALSKGIALCSNDQLITSSALNQYRKAKAKVSGVECTRLDTVGAVSLGLDWHCTAACSSGGFLIKSSGRLGLCTQLGGGVWAERRGEKSVAVTLSGCGEYISKTLLAYKIASALLDCETEECLPSECIRATFVQAFCNSPLLSLFPKERILAGGLAICADKDAKCAELYSFHNTDHLPFAYDDGRAIRRMFSLSVPAALIVLNSTLPLNMALTYYKSNMDEDAYRKRFTIPNRDDDLLETNDEFYTVEINPTLDIIDDKIKDFESQIEFGDWKCILNHFDYYFYCIRFNFDADPWQYRKPLIMLLSKGLSAVLDSAENLLPVLANMDSNSDDVSILFERKQHLRALQMYSYLLCRLSQLFETEAQNRQKSLSAITAKKTGRKAQVEESAKLFIDDWAVSRERILDVLQKMVTMNFQAADGQIRNAAIRFLWQPPIVCSNFVDIIASYRIVVQFNTFRLLNDLVLKFLENPDLYKVSYRQWLYSIFGFLRVLSLHFEDCTNLSTFSKVLELGIQMVSLMKHLDYLALSSINHSPFVEAIDFVCENDELNTLLFSMLSALGRLSSSDFARNEVSARPFALFITTLSEKKPQFLNKNVAYIVPFLSDDQPTLRCAVLTAFFEIITSIYKEKSLELEACQARDKLLLYLQDHIVDVNANVRSRALQLWTRLAKSTQIPLVFIQNCLIHDASCRFLDKSIFVRKNAASFLSTFLDHNPFGPSLSSDGLKAKLNQLYEEYRELQKQSPENDLVRNTVEEWKTIQESILETIKSVIEHKNEEDRKVNDIFNDAEDFVNGELVNSSSPEKCAEKSVSSDGAVADNDALEKEICSKINSGMWEEVIIPFINNSETRISAVEAFVTAFLKNSIPNFELNHGDDNLPEKLLDVIYQAFLKYRISEELVNDEQMVLEQDKLEGFEAEVLKVKKKIRFLQYALCFAIEMEKSLELALRSVMTGQANELSESIKFIVEASKFEVKGSSRAVRELFRVIWKRDNAVQEVLVNAAKDLFVSCNENHDVAIRKTTENLFKVILGATEEERVSIEQVGLFLFTTTVIYSMIQKDVLSVEVYDLIAEVLFSSSGPLRVAALRLFSLFLYLFFAFRAKKRFMQERFDVFLELLNDDGFFNEDDGTLATEFFNLISNFGSLPDMKNLSTISRKPFRLDDSHSIFDCIQQLLICGFVVNEYRWMDVLVKGLNAIFYVDAQPCQRISSIANDLLKLTKSVITEALKAKSISDNFASHKTTELGLCSLDINELIEKEEIVLQEMGGLKVSTKEASEGLPCLDEEELQEKVMKELQLELEHYTSNAVHSWNIAIERLCFFVGEIALKLLIHVDISFVAEMKRKNEVLNILRAGPNKDPAVADLMKTIPEFPDNRQLSKLEEESLMRIGFFEVGECDGDDRLELNGMSGDEKLLQKAEEICEKDLLKSSALLGRFLPLIFHILEIKRNSGCENIKSAAALALSKIMLLSSEFCEHSLPIFLDCLANSPSAICRNNLLIAAGDICFRFPNIIEGCSEHIYNRIADTDNYVRQTCIIVLTHLLLNDMIKIRTAIADIAKCIVDEDESIAELSNYLFAELSKKGNIIYNMMPDIISRLSTDNEVCLDEFMRIMKTLLSLIKKDKHSDNLLDKLCFRLRTCIDQNGVIDERLAERLSFCISKLPLSEKSISVLTEHLPALSHLLHFDPVYNDLHSTLFSLRRIAVRNNELKAELESLIEELNRLRNMRVDYHEMEDRAFLQARVRTFIYF
uniref:Asparaginase n=1 Tax=Syphacia muris TaxID=451379 RepID=A0A0N5AEA3_9BILA